MLSFPNAKINLGLNILSKREDGYHNIISCLYPIPWHDVLEIIISDSFSFQQTGLKVEGSADDNLVVRAYHLLQNDFDLAPVSIHLHKVIPMGAGLGGGSSDAAFSLKILRAIFNLPITNEKLKAYAAQLGSDCPFFIENLPVIARDTGTELSPIDLDLSDYWIAIIYPAIHVGTREAYAGVEPSYPDLILEEILKNKPQDWQHLTNDFERSIFPLHPNIKQIKDSLTRQGAIYSAMSGSGSAVFGLFEEEPTLKGFDGLQKLISRMKL